MSRYFRPANDLLAQYAAYHRDRRNIATHLVGVPMIVLAVALLLVPGQVQLGALTLSWAWVACVLAGCWYVTRGHFGLGAATALAIASLVWAAQGFQSLAGAASALGWGAGLFALGWVIQFIGHYYEGRKPAFADDLVGLLVGPMFVVMELLAPLGLFKGLVAEIERRAGRTYFRDLAHPLP
jgi:uncharacterized membrane protein YGL010W